MRIDDNRYLHPVRFLKFRGNFTVFIIVFICQHNLDGSTTKKYSLQMADETLFSFTETVVFTEDLLEFADDDTLYAIQNALLENPYLGDVIQGTSGARKGRVANPKQKSGKRGGFRFIYVYLEKADRIYLLYFYSKRERTDLNKSEKDAIAERIRILKKEYRESE